MAGSSGFLFDEVRVVQALLDFWLTKGKRGMLFGIFCETIEIRQSLRESLWSKC